MTNCDCPDEKPSDCGCGCNSVVKEKCPVCGMGVIKFLIFVFLIIVGLFAYIKYDDIAIGAMDVKTVSIERSDLKSFPVEVEIAATLEQQQIGLMNRTELAPGKGMLFTYKEPQQVRFWMKDTLLPLDILFVSPNGVIHKIVQGAKPHDETPIPSEMSVLGVLELPAGDVKRMGVTVGDTIRIL